MKMENYNNMTFDRKLGNKKKKKILFTHRMKNLCATQEIFG